MVSFAYHFRGWTHPPTHLATSHWNADWTYDTLWVQLAFILLPPDTTKKEFQLGRLEFDPETEQWQEKPVNYSEQIQTEHLLLRYRGPCNSDSFID